MATRIVRRLLELALVGLAVGLLGVVLLVRGVPMSGRLVLVVGGGSMAPALPVGSAVIVQPIPISSLRVGDIVTIEVGPEHAIFTHRITRLVDRADGLWIETKGDANATPDPTIIPATSVKGRVQVVAPAVGYAIAALSRPEGFAAALGVAGILLAMIMLLDGSNGPAPVSARPAGEPAPVPARQPAYRPSSKPPRRPAARGAGGT